MRLDWKWYFYAMALISVFLAVQLASMFLQIRPQQRSEKQTVADPSHAFVVRDSAGKLLFRTVASQIFKYKDDRALFQRNGQWGFLDPAGREVVPPQFDSASSFSEGAAVVGVKDKHGFLDKSGDWLIKPKFARAAPFRRGLAKVMERDKWGCIDKNGTWVIPPNFDELGELSDGLMAAARQGKWGFIDRQGKWVISPAYDKVSVFSERLAGFAKCYKSTSPVAQVMDRIAENLSGPQYCGPWGFIDTAGKVVIEPKLDFDYDHSYFLEPRIENGIVRWYNGDSRVESCPTRVRTIHGDGTYTWQTGDYLSVSGDFLHEPPLPIVTKTQVAKPNEKSQSDASSSYLIELENIPDTAGGRN